MTRLFSRDYLECYERIAQDDLYKAFEPQPWRRQIPILRMIGDTKHELVIDVGAGKGWTISHLRGTKVAVDPALNYLRSSKFGDSHRIRAIGEYLPLKACADVMICDSVLEHVLNPSKVVQEMHRVLKDSGRLIVSVPFKEDLSPYRKLTQLYPYTHLRSFDKNAMANLLIGFRIEKMRTVHLKQYPMLVRFLLRQLKLRCRLLYRVVKTARACPYVILSIDSLFWRFQKSYSILLSARKIGQRQVPRQHHPKTQGTFTSDR